MQYKSTSGKIIIIRKPVARPLIDDNVKKNSAIRNIKRKIIVLLSIELIVMMIYLIAQIVSLISFDIRTGKIYKGIIIESFITLVSIVYLITFIIVITQHFSFPILIFIWLSLIQLIGGSVLFLLAIVAIFISLSLINSVGIGIIIDIIFYFCRNFNYYFIHFYNSLFIEFNEIDQKLSFRLNTIQSSEIMDKDMKRLFLEM